MSHCKKKLTPPRNKPVFTPGLLRIQRMKEFVLSRRRLWYPGQQAVLVRLLRRNGFYPVDTCEGVILRDLLPMIAKLRAANKGYHRKLAQQVPRDTPEWSRLILLAKGFRKSQCSNPERRLRRGILLLCVGPIPERARPERAFAPAASPCWSAGI